MAARPAGRSYLNSSSGIFIGFDALGDHAVRRCSAYNNRQNGIFNGAPMSQRVLLENNREYGNRGLPPDQSWLLAAQGLGTGKDGQPKSNRRGAKGIASGGVLGEENPFAELASCLDDREHQKWLSRCKHQ